MYQLKTKIDVYSEDFKANREAFLKLLNEYKTILETTTRGGSEKSLKRHKDRCKLLARERINLLIDPNTPFLEMSPLAAYNQYNNEFPSAGIVTGVGVIHGQETVIIANDATVKGGTYMRFTIKKHLRAQQVAMENHLPCVYMVEAGYCFSRCQPFWAVFLQPGSHVSHGHSANFNRHGFLYRRRCLCAGHE